jgi:hypothetical protein
MKNKSELVIRVSLCNAGYSEETVEKILRFYTLSEESARSKQLRIKAK